MICRSSAFQVQLFVIPVNLNLQLKQCDHGEATEFDIRHDTSTGLKVSCEIGKHFICAHENRDMYECELISSFKNSETITNKRWKNYIRVKDNGQRSLTGSYGLMTLPRRWC